MCPAVIHSCSILIDQRLFKIDIDHMTTLRTMWSPTCGYAISNILRLHNNTILNQAIFFLY